MGRTLQHTFLADGKGDELENKTNGSEKTHDQRSVDFRQQIIHVIPDTITEAMTHPAYPIHSLP